MIYMKCECGKDAVIVTGELSQTGIDANGPARCASCMAADLFAVMARGSEDRATRRKAGWMISSAEPVLREKNRKDWKKKVDPGKPRA